MGECTGITFIDSTRIPVCENKRQSRNRVFKGYAQKGKSIMGSNFIFCVMNEGNYSTLHSSELI
nr:transposase [Alloprevotella rava]